MAIEVGGMGRDPGDRLAWDFFHLRWRSGKSARKLSFPRSLRGSDIITFSSSFERLKQLLVKTDGILVSHDRGRDVGTISFGRFEVDLQDRIISKSGITVRLAPQPFTILAALLEARGTTVTREELRRQLWPDGTFLEYEPAINVAMRRLREVLGESNSNPIYIETVPRIGYRWIFPLTTATQSSEAGTISPPPSQDLPGDSNGSYSKVPVESKSDAPQISISSPPREPAAPRRSLWWSLALGVAVLGVTLVMGVPLFRNRAADPPQGAVIVRGGFECVGCPGDQAYLAPGIADRLSSDLVRIPGVHVLVAQDATPVSSAPRAVKLVLVGKIAPHGESKVVVTISLASAATHEQLWSKNYETVETGLAALEFSIANDIFRYLKPSLPAQDQTPLKAAWTRDPEAYDLYLRGRDHFGNPGPANIAAEIQDFSEAIRRDPGFAAAYGGLARAYTGAPYFLGTPMPEAAQLVKANALREIELDPLASDGRASLAFEEFDLESKWKSAEVNFQQAISLNPEDPLAHSWYSSLLNLEGRDAEAIQQAKLAISLDPNASGGDSTLAVAEIYGSCTSGDCVATCKDALRRYPGSDRLQNLLVWALWETHRYKESADEELAAAELTKDEAAIRFQQSARSILSARGPAQYALAEARYCESQMGGANACGIETTAEWYALGGNSENAIRLLRILVDNHSPGVNGFPFSPFLVSLRSDPRFQKLVAQIHPGSD